MTQQFNKGDHVRVADDLGPAMAHFEKGCEAIVMYSYAERYGGSDRNSYCLHIKGHGQVSWYYGQQLALLEAGRLDLLQQWEQEKEAEIKLKSGRGWIFDNGPEVLKSPHGASIETLGRDLGLDNLWGSHGEGLVWYSNALAILAVAGPFLAAKDKAGWMNYCRRTNPGAR